MQTAKGQESAYFLSVNRNKKSVAINFRTEQGQKILKDLVQKSDVLVENFVPGKLATYGLDYKSLKEIAPHLIYCSITGFGSSGPYANRAGYDVIAASIGGLLHITGPKVPILVISLNESSQLWRSQDLRRCDNGHSCHHKTWQYSRFKESTNSSELDQKLHEYDISHFNDKSQSLSSESDCVLFGPFL